MTNARMEEAMVEGLMAVRNAFAEAPEADRKRINEAYQAVQGVVSGYGDHGVFAVSLLILEYMVGPAAARSD